MFEPFEFTWDTGRLRVVLAVDAGQIMRIRELRAVDSTAPQYRSVYFDSAALPLVELRLAGQGSPSFKGAKSLVGTQGARSLVYQSHKVDTTSDLSKLTVVTRECSMGMQVTVELTAHPEIAAVRSIVTAENQSRAPVTLFQLSSLVVGGLSDGRPGWHRQHSLLFATNSWFREAQWHEHPLPRLGIDDVGLYQLRQGHDAPLSHFSIGNHGMFSTEGHLPIGVLLDNVSGDTWAWQVENNGSWRWEIGDYRNSGYVALTGPTGTDHEWAKSLAPGESFTTVPAVVCRARGGLDEAFAELNKYRRTIVSLHEDHHRLPVIFNDYMNCLMGDPSAEKIRALLAPAARAGAEYFCVDCGWYANDGDWWFDVGLWTESRVRFPAGLRATLDEIREHGMRPGLWLEPEVVGVHSKVAEELPDECFFVRYGQRVLEKGRYQLDFSNAKTVEHMDAIIDRLVNELGVEYFKFDYNIDPVQGSDRNGVSPGDGQFRHNRAHLEWLRGILARHKGLVIENCASGGQRLDYALLSVLPLQSTSDQQDPLLYAPIAAAMPTAVLPMQGASWCYPQPGWTDEQLAFTVVNSLLGRVHLSGRIDLLNNSQLQLVTDGLDVHRQIRKHLPSMVAFWPLGLPRWSDDWVALGMLVPGGDAYLSVWRRGGAESCSLPLKGSLCVKEAAVVYPPPGIGQTQVHLGDGCVNVTIISVNAARFLKLTRA